MFSIRAAAAGMGLVGDRISLLHDIHGLHRLPNTLLDGDVELLAQLRRVRWPHVNLNLIRVGAENFDHPDEVEISGASLRMRRSYDQVRLGVARIKHYAIPLDAAEGHNDISSDDEAESLTENWTVHNNGIDVFVVRSEWTDDDETHAGATHTSGPCDKDQGGWTGAVVSLQNLSLISGMVLGHEVGHYLGLSHVIELADIEENPDNVEAWMMKNLMFPTNDFGGMELLSWQGQAMYVHCSIRPGV